MRINGHGHILPEPSQIPKFLKDKKLFWIDDNKKFMRQGDWSRPISDPSFFLNEKIEWMRQYKIDHSVMLCLSQLYCNGWEKNTVLMQYVFKTTLMPLFKVISQINSPVVLLFNLYIWIMLLQKLIVVLN